VIIGAVEVFWIVTEWPSGAQAILFAAITVLLLAPRADEAYASAVSFAVGAVLATVLRRDRQICCVAEFGDLCRL
jgi:Fusaric acid resistance protein family